MSNLLITITDVEGNFLELEFPASEAEAAKAFADAAAKSIDTASVQIDELEDEEGEGDD